MADVGGWGATARVDPARASGRLSNLVHDLERERMAQLALDCAWGGLFLGLVASCALVLAIRIGDLPVEAGAGTLWLVALALAGAAVVAWRRRPDSLDVAIEADLTLGLEQKLSTAWEFVRREPNAALSGRLAAQAMRVRMPTRRQVFPLRMNTWGRLTPIAAVALMLVALVEVPAPDGSRTAADPILVEEGTRLREYGQRMERRARRESLPRSAAQATRMQRLGSRMESGALTRGKALSRLRGLSDSLDEQRRAALGDAALADLDSRALGAMAGSPSMSEGGLGALLAKLRDGSLGLGDLESLRAEMPDLSALGITREQIERALDEFAEGDGQALRKILEKVARRDESVREALELLQAEQVVEKARENLGEQRYQIGPGGQPGEPEEDAGDGETEDLGLLTGQQVDGGADQAGHFIPGGRGLGRNGPERMRSPAARSDAKASDAMIKPQSQLGEGQMMALEARVLPRPGEVTTPAAAIDARFRAQMEAVLSKQDYPVHHKALVRRYFLSISEGAAGDGKESNSR